MCKICLLLLLVQLGTVPQEIKALSHYRSVTRLMYFVCPKIGTTPDKTVFSTLEVV